MKNSGFVLLDKPSGISSRMAGNKIARMFDAKKFGHIGTLDPMASGILIIALNEATKIIPYFPNDYKEYIFSIKWGVETETLDMTGKIIKQDDNLKFLSDKILQQVCNEFIGSYNQVPPNFSAIHIDGQRAYKMAISGKNPNIPPRLVHIYDLTVINSFSFIVKCSSGTYVRSLARDIAEKCGTIASCASIRRTETNGFNIKNTRTLDFLENLFNNGGRAAINEYLQRIDFGLGDIPVLNLNINDAVLFKHGVFLTRATFVKNGLFRVYSDNGFIGIGIVQNSVLKPKRIINVD